MLVFIGQTGMNLSQARVEPRAEYRWQTGDEDYIIRVVYKCRRQGEASFAVFRSYRDHFAHYLAWLDELGLSKDDDRLFPFIYPVSVPAAHRPPRLDALKSLCIRADIPWVSPRDLRKIRVNWLLRRSRDPDLTADMSGHHKETLLRVYEEGDLQSASQEIGAFHARTDPTLTASRATPVCLKGDGQALPLPETPTEAALPDCVTPEGCLWCAHARDVLTLDYCWKLVSHRYLKSLEIALFHPSTPQQIHPAYLVIDRLTAKLDAIAARSDMCARWVKEAKESAREGSYHPSWKGLIETLEIIV